MVTMGRVLSEACRPQQFCVLINYPEMHAQEVALTHLAGIPLTIELTGIHDDLSHMIVQ